MRFLVVSRQWLVVSAVCLAAVFANADEMKPFGQKLMVDQHGEIYPKGATLGLDDVAELAMSNKLNEAKIETVKEVQASTRREVDLVVKTLTGVNAYAYVDDFVESLGGVSGVNTNAQCAIAKFEVGARHEIIDGVDFSAHDLFYYFTEPMNNTPFIQFQTALKIGETNVWDKIELQETVYLGTATIDGIEYENCYRSTVWTLAALDKCFYRVKCEISPPVGDGSTFDIFGGITLNGDKGDTKKFHALNYQGETNTLHFVGGLLKTIGPYEPEEGGVE